MYCRVVPRINQLEPLHPSYHLQAVEPWHSIEDDEVEVAVYDGKLLGARIPFYLNVTVLLRDFPVLPVPFILHGDATLASVSHPEPCCSFFLLKLFGQQIKSAMSTITGLPLTCFYLAGDETPENTTAHNLWTVKELQWFFRRASLNLQLVPRNSRAECGYTYFKAGAFDPETVVEYHQSSNSVRRVFAFWLGNTPMSAARAQCFDTLNKTELDVVLVTEATLQLWLLPEAPLHPSFWSLSAAHQADYLRAYFTHFHGGGYTNIKCTSESWLPAVKALEADHSKLGVGYPEIGPEGVTFLFDPALNSMLHRDWASLLGIQAYVFRPRTEFTSAWYHGMLQVMDKYADELLAHPAPHAQASTREGGYPLRWTELLGEVFHPLCHTFRNRLLRTLPVPPM